LEAAPAVRQRFSIIPAAMRHVAHLAIRSRGTIAGSLSHADPAAELPMLARLLEAHITAVGPGGDRVIAAGEFFDSALATVLAEDEIVTAVNLPNLPAGAGWAFEEVARRLGDFALTAMGAIVTIKDGLAVSVRLAVAGAGETPLRLDAAEALVAGERLSPALLDAAAEAARGAVDPMTDLHGSADYRRHLVGVLTRRVLTAAWQRAGGEGI
jgi:carbon-monoxide dehydrogenase medium subunit